ncbi:MAG: DUF4956 domain-containing protein [Candidatus Gastranaerophilales bacterium]|nr:DUF4956 domain-containing protein [Candidatus Gastranaerophilales bacterium]
MNNLDLNIIADIPVLMFVQTFLLAIFYGIILAFVLKKTSKIIGDKSQYIAIYPIIIPIMVLIISVIKTSLALSLGLVGALSIIRFRTPIKEPEELCYMFIAIAVGLGLGAGQILPATISFLIIILLLIGISSFKNHKEICGVFLDIDYPSSENFELSAFSQKFIQEKINFDLRKYEESNENNSITYYIEPENIGNLEKLLKDLKQIKPDAKFMVINRVHQ